MAMDSSVKKTTLKLVLLTLTMFGFGFAMVPLYDVFCEVTGINGKTSNTPYQYQTEKVSIDESRIVTIQFVTNNNDKMGWDFYPKTTELKVHPGQLESVVFFAHNPSEQAMVAQAIPSIAPFDAADYLHKTECFCFNQQRLTSGEKVDMPMRFVIDQALPKHIKKLTLSYTLFDVTPSHSN
ncbi:cytochrome c oxidase assembly protein [Zooshikella ganghwensis]|uniref:Cytochrome c oxidase assembly protein CtaG n=2 Tax=Zooshikella ganghwensis TaxID=202772 RepID=A0A4V1IN07_9GAMM|nr:cytochrome c oxidase assembly protein [Zooshikella ganghwensis]RDH42071.1 cytochrome c oxidase assembly protein [Zooshikella ganghwensis]